jgi:MoxR-like ATPase
VVPTLDLCRMQYAMELLIVAKRPVLVFGAQATGKSTLVRSALYRHLG